MVESLFFIQLEPETGIKKAGAGQKRTGSATLQVPVHISLNYSTRRAVEFYSKYCIFSCIHGGTATQGKTYREATTTMLHIVVAIANNAHQS